MKKTGSKYYPILLIILIDLVFLTFTYDDYGVGWDEPSSRDIGVNNALMANYYLDHIFYTKGDLDIRVKSKIEKNGHENYLNQEKREQYTFKMYGPAFELVLVGIERILDIKNDKKLFTFRHLATHLFYLLGLFIFYLLIHHHFKDNPIASFATIMLLLIPRLYPHTFYNPKDIPFLVSSIIAAFTLFKFLDNRSYFNAIIHALTCAWAIDIRIIGILFPALTFLLLTVDLFFVLKEKQKINIKAVKSVVLYSLFLIVFVIFLWPYLWKNPINHFLWSFESMSKYPWTGEVLFLGEIFEPIEYIPASYFPVWFGITIPLVFLFLFSISFFSFPAIKLSNLSSKRPKKRLFLISLFLFMTPWVMAIILKSVLYDDGRHFFFIYPFFIVLVIFGWCYLKEKVQMYFQLKSTYYYSVTILFLLPLALKMFTLHPFQYLYFNSLAPQNIEKKFELDYYGISYQKGLDFLLKTEKASILIMKGDPLLFPVFCNSLLLTDEEVSRISYVENMDDANFFLTTYRTIIDRIAYLKYKNIKPEWEIYSIEVEGNKILSVFELPKDR